MATATGRVSANFSREIKILPAYDYRDEPGDQRGASGMRMLFILRGPLGIVSATIDTGWVAHPLLRHWNQHGLNERAKKPGVDRTLADIYPSANYVGTHTPVQREGGRDYAEPCDLLEGGECFGTGGYTAADEVLDLLISEGSDAVWGHLAGLYQRWIADQPIEAAEVSS